MKNPIIIILCVTMALFSGCSLVEKAGDAVFETTTKTNYVERVVTVPVLSTNIVSTKKKVDVFDTKGDFIGFDYIDVKTEVVKTNLVPRRIQNPIIFEQKTMRPQVESVAKTAGGLFGPIGEGITGLALLAIGAYARTQNARKRKEAERRAKAEDEANDLNQVGKSLTNGIDIAKEIIQGISTNKLEEYVGKLKKGQKQDGTREKIRKIFLGAN